MAKRESIYVIKRIQVEGTDPDWKPPEDHPNLLNPNRYAPEITVEVRVHFPPHAKHLKVMTAYDQAFEQVEREYVNTYVLPTLIPELDRKHSPR